MRLAAIILVAVLGAFAILFVSQPSSYVITRTRKIAVAPEKVIAALSDLRVMTKIYPTIEEPESRTYSADPIGVGAWVETRYAKRVVRTTVASVSATHVQWDYDTGIGAGQLGIRAEVRDGEVALSIAGGLSSIRRALWPFVSLDARVGRDLDGALVNLESELR